MLVKFRMRVYDPVNYMAILGWEPSSSLAAREIRVNPEGQLCYAEANIRNSF